MISVSDIMTENVVTVNENKYVSEAQAALIQNNISGAPVVDDSGNLIGFISKTDITHFHSIGGDIDYAKVGEIASSRLFCIASTESVLKAAQMLIENHVHHLIVTQEGQIAGIVSALDLVKVLVNKLYLSELSV